MLNVHKTLADLETDLRKHGYRRVGAYWERGERHVSFSRLSTGQCADGRWLAMHAPHLPR